MSEVREFWITKGSGIPRKYTTCDLWSIEHKPELKSHDSVEAVNGEVAVVTNRHWECDTSGLDVSAGYLEYPALGMGAEPKIARIRVEILDD